MTLIVLPPSLRRLRRSAPGIDLRFRNIDRDSITPLLDRAVIDVAIGIEPKPLPKRFAPKRLFDERVVCIARKGHPAFAADRVPMTPAEFAALPHLLVTPRDDLAGPVDASLARHGLTRRIAVAVPHFLSAPFAVGASGMVAVLTERTIARFSPAAGIVVHPTPVDVAGWSVDLVRPTDVATDGGLAWLCKEIQTVAAML